MTGRRLFGTDGIRDIAGEGLLSREAVARWGGAVAAFLSGRGEGGRPVVLGRDTRESGGWIAESLSGALAKAGHAVLDAGVCPTGAVSFLVRRRSAALGVVVSASHNPPEYNGIKLIERDGRKLDDAGEIAVERLWSEGRGPAAAAGSVAPLAWRKEYVAALKAFLPRLDLSGRRILLDCASGAAYEAAPEALAAFGADVRRIDPAPDGRNINERAGALHPEKLVAAVRREPGSAAFAFDGDADRCLYVDGTGTLRDGDDLLAFAGAVIHRMNPEKPASVVATDYSNGGLGSFLSPLGVSVIKTEKVGDRNVTEKVLQTRAIIGAEPSGHVVIPDWGPTGDGIVTALTILDLERAAGKRMEESLSGFVRFASVARNVPVRAKPLLDSLPEVSKVKREVEAALGKNGRLLLRYSGTEPLARILVEGPDQTLCQDSATALARVIQRQIGIDTDRGP